mgnify:CR=1 FL=1
MAVREARLTGEAHAVAAMRRVLGDSDAAANSARIIINDLNDLKK